MSFGQAVFQIFIEPLTIIYEFVFFYAKLFTKNTGISVIVLSLVVNFLLLPLYCRADAAQSREREQEKRMEHWIKHIKKTFSGNERFMMLQTYYRQNDYKPYYAVRGLLPLILEIPFFIAAYNYLSGLGELSNAFLFLENMAEPERMLKIGGMAINLLPVLMTVINIISSAVYTKDLRLKDKVQLYGMAILFLVLLYHSPSGLVLYWTVNNLFSLVKNIIMRFKGNHNVINFVFSGIGAAIIIFSLVFISGNIRILTFFIDVGLVCQLPWLVTLIKKYSSFGQSSFGKSFAKLRVRIRERTPKFGLFASGCIFMTLLTGLLIPSSVVASSPMEFVLLSDYHSPFLHIVNSFLLASGFFMVWFMLIYYLANRSVRNILEILILMCSVCAVINYMFFATNLGTLSADLKILRSPFYGFMEDFINICVILGVSAILFFIWKKSRRAVQTLYIALFIAVAGVTGVNASKIQEAEPDILKAVENYKPVEEQGNDDIGKIIHLSKNKQNVIVFMLDRAISSYLPYIFNEKPELKEKFDGFTYYPNTISYGVATNFGAPALYGGYEYTPEEMNKRSSEKLSDKHDEALKVMPVLFDENGYDVTVIEPTYAGYSWVPDISIFDEYPDMKVYNVEEGQVHQEEINGRAMELQDVWRRNFFCYSIMKISPCVMHSFLYNYGTYYDKSSSAWQAYDGVHQDIGMNDGFLGAYFVLKNLGNMTVSEETENNTFLMMSNSTTHEVQLLQTPDYTPSYYVDNTTYDMLHSDRFTYNGVTANVTEPFQMKHYHINMGALLRMGEWFDYMRENGVYDNTRIIIAADHGAPELCSFDDMIADFSAGGIKDVLDYNPLFLVKDFNSRGFKTDMSFMTNADTPVLAMKGLISEPVNPFTGKPVNSDAKKGEQPLILSELWDIEQNDGNTFAPSRWYSVHDNIFDLGNWKELDFH